MDYAAFLDRKAQLSGDFGFAPVWMPDFLFDFQRALVEWACRKGRGALFEDCGLGKTPQQLVWAENVMRHTNRPVLILTPLAVSAQTIAEAAKFGIEAKRSPDGVVFRGLLTVTNYERLHHFTPTDFGGVVCDESSILKSFDGATKAAVTDFMRKIKYRLCCTATAAPNDYTELGTTSEALGYLGHMDMLTRFFVNDQGNSSHRLMQRARFAHTEAGQRWRFKGHAVDQFWRWVCSWARALRRPSDLGYDDARFVLPPLVEQEHVVKARTKAPGCLFEMPANGLHEEREEARRTIEERCEMAAALVADTGQPAVVWCHLNAEGDRLTDLIPGAVQVNGSDEAEEKEEKFAAFASGQTRVLVTKPKIGAWGLNWQHCAHMTFFPSHSFEQYYQAVRRSWRFGQTRPVVVDIVATDGAAGIRENLQRKSAAADEMFSALVRHMNNAMALSGSRAFDKEVEVPSWL